MKSITTFSLLILVASMVFGGMTNSIYAQDDPAILLKLAKRAQNQIENQISSDSPDKIKKLFNEGIHEVNALEKAIRNDDVDSAKDHFLLAMKIFTEISRYSPPSDVATETTASDIAPKTTSESKHQNVKDPSNDIQRLQVYVNSLKTIAKKYNTSIDFTQLDELFSISRQQISNHEFVQALETLQEIKETIIEINKQIREEATKKESQRAKEYAQQYLEQLDRLIENAKKQDLSDEIIQKLENAKENLSSADNPSEIVEQIRKIISIKDQFELTKNDRLESRVLQVEKTLLRLSQIDQVDQDAIVNAKNTLNSIKRSLSDGEIDVANDLLRNLAKQLEEIKNSL
ncbi:MAG: hypothetical protein K5790_08310 [Nitrosopumilus sp.]|uniref:hypothetical protein n=1 Tax=Nitrosopumilus sp. TaxID=2024843 RepID=UPI00247BEA83|nr:hypothetical protein [Nitrosopumilus sp.]MCV0393271.1 hypothetical protein [Nitrosopumilus sp.]